VVKSSVPASTNGNGSVDQARDPTLGDLLDLHGDVLLDNVHTMLPGRVVAYDADKQLADVQPLVKHRRLDEDGQTMIAEALPVVNSCPVVFCGTARGRITWPVFVGDTCEIRFASASIARWIRQGGLVDPGEDRRHDLTDGVCFVGLHDAAHVPTTAPTDAIVTHVGPGVLIKHGGPDATESNLLGDTYRAAEDALNSAAAALMNAVVGIFGLLQAATPTLTGAPAAIAAFNAAITPAALAALLGPFNSALLAFNAGAPSYKSLIVKSK
jgi:hypothetical protein